MEPEDQQNLVFFGKGKSFFTTRQKSSEMARVRSKNSNPEQLLCKALWAKGVRYRKHKLNLPGKPDIAILRHRVVVFVDGEFWHGYNWDSKKADIKKNRAFWIPKIERNIARDQKNSALLRELGYQVIRLWSREVTKNTESCVQRILTCIKENSGKVAELPQGATGNSL